MCVCVCVLGRHGYYYDPVLYMIEAGLGKYALSNSILYLLSSFVPFWESSFWTQEDILPQHQQSVNICNSRRHRRWNCPTCELKLPSRVLAILSTDRLREANVRQGSRVAAGICTAMKYLRCRQLARSSIQAQLEGAHTHTHTRARRSAYRGMGGRGKGGRGGRGKGPSRRSKCQPSGGNDVPAVPHWKFMKAVEFRPSEAFATCSSSNRISAAREALLVANC